MTYYRPVKSRRRAPVRLRKGRSVAAWTTTKSFFTLTLFPGAAWGPERGLFLRFAGMGGVAACATALCEECGIGVLSLPIASTRCSVASVLSWWVPRLLFVSNDLDGSRVRKGE